ncbi:MAG: hypothetical protein L0229_19325, partial [Blastocatellia bacterium]|nr:hypothetical protein [Blastocatellia bacterium]
GDRRRVEGGGVSGSQKGAEKTFIQGRVKYNPDPVSIARCFSISRLPAAGLTGRLASHKISIGIVKKCKGRP